MITPAQSAGASSSQQRMGTQKEVERYIPAQQTTCGVCSPAPLSSAFIGDITGNKSWIPRFKFKKHTIVLNHDWLSIVEMGHLRKLYEHDKKSFKVDTAKSDTDFGKLLGIRENGDCLCEVQAARNRPQKIVLVKAEEFLGQKPTAGDLGKNLDRKIFGTVGKAPKNTVTKSRKSSRSGRRCL